MISPSQRPLPDNTPHSQQTEIHALGGIRTRNPSKRAAVDPLLRPRGKRDRHRYTYMFFIKWCLKSNINCVWPQGQHYSQPPPPKKKFWVLTWPYWSHYSASFLTTYLCGYVTKYASITLTKGLTIRGLIPGKGKTIFSLPKVDTGCSDTTCSLSKGTWDISPGLRRVELESDHSYLYSAESKRQCYYNVTLPRAFLARMVTSLAIHFLYSDGNKYVHLSHQVTVSLYGVHSAVCLTTGP